MLNYINALAYIEGYIYANIYISNIVVKLDLKKDEVVALYDFSYLTELAKQMYKDVFGENL